MSGPVSVLVLVLIAYLCLISLPVCESKKVCIIGSGISGASAAYFTAVLGGSAYDIHVFERSSAVGGRLRDVHLLGDRFEAGGSIIHPANRQMWNFTAACNLSQAATPFDTPSIGMWDSKRFVFKDIARGNTFWSRLCERAVSKLRAVWRYGFSPLRMSRSTNGFLAKFLAVYNKLEESSFETVEDLFTSLGLYELSQIGLDQVLLEEGVTPRVINEIAAAITRINYNQNTTMSGLAGAVALAASGKLWQVKGGNKQVPECLVKLAQAKLYLRTEVTAIFRTQSGGYNVTTSGGESQYFDAVIIATPLPLAELKLDPPVRLPKMEMQHTHTTFVRGLLNQDYFGVSDTLELPRTVATLEDPAIPFSSIGVQKEYEPGKDYAYKVFSREPPSDQLLDYLFRWRNETVRIDWAAYPKYPVPSVMGRFRLDDYHLYYANAMEAAISCMETGALGAENVVKLMLRDFAHGAPGRTKDSNDGLSVGFSADGLKAEL